MTSAGEKNGPQGRFFPSAGHNQQHIIIITNFLFICHFKINITLIWCYFLIHLPFKNQYNNNSVPNFPFQKSISITIFNVGIWIGQKGYYHAYMPPWRVADKHTRSPQSKQALFYSPAISNHEMSWLWVEHGLVWSA